MIRNQKNNHRFHLTSCQLSEVHLALVLDLELDLELDHKLAVLVRYKAVHIVVDHIAVDRIVVGVGCVVVDCIVAVDHTVVVVDHTVVVVDQTVVVVVVDHTDFVLGVEQPQKLLEIDLAVDLAVDLEVDLEVEKTGQMAGHRLEKKVSKDKGRWAMKDCGLTMGLLSPVRR